jgi:RimJ/RimL family protein N-acetyltransferase
MTLQNSDRVNFISTEIRELELQTPRLLLRQWKPSDLEPFAKMNADPVVMEHFLATSTLEQTKAFIEGIKDSFDTRGYGLFATELKETGAFIGFVGLWPARFETNFTPCVEVGYRLAKEYWGKGYAPEAARQVLKFGFEVIKFEEIFSWTATTNTNSMRVMEKIGLQRDLDNDFDYPSIPEGHRLRRHVLYRLKASEFICSN